MADGREIALVFRVLQFDLFLRQPIPIDRANQLLIFLQQPLTEFLSLLLIVHLCPLFVLQNPPGLATGKWEYMLRDRPVNTTVGRSNFHNRYSPRVLLAKAR